MKSIKNLFETTQLDDESREIFFRFPAKLIRRFVRLNLNRLLNSVLDETDHS